MLSFSPLRQKRPQQNEPLQTMALIRCDRFFLSKPQMLQFS